MVQLTTKQKGNLTQLRCLSAFVQQGCTVCIPYGDNAKYDFIVDIDKKLFRVQAKTSTPKGDASFGFSCRSTHVNSQGCTNETYSSDDIDYFATYWKGECYLIPIEECNVGKILRLQPTKNGQKKGISFAKDYILADMVERIRNSQ